MTEGAAWYSPLNLQLDNLGMSNSQMKNLAAFATLPAFFYTYVVPNDKDLLISHLTQALKMMPEISTKLAELLMNADYSSVNLGHHRVFDRVYPPPLNPSDSVANSQRFPLMNGSYVTDIQQACNIINSHTADSQKDTLQALDFLIEASISDQLRASLATLGICPLILSLLHQSVGSDSEIVDGAISVICNISLSDEMERDLVHRGCVPLLVKTAIQYMNSDPKIVSRTLKALGNLECCSDAMISAYEDGVIMCTMHALVKYMDTHKGIVKNGCNVIFAISLNTTLPPILCQFQCIEVLINVLSRYQHGEEDVSAYAIRALSILTGDQQCLKVFVGHHGVDIVKSMFHKYLDTNPAIIASLTTILANLASNQSTRESVVTDGIMNKLIDLLHGAFSNNAQVIIGASSTLKAFASDPMMEDTLASKGAVEYLVDCLRRYEKKKACAYAIIGALTQLTFSDLTRARFILHGGIIPTVNIVQRFTKDIQMIEIVFDLLENISKDVSAIPHIHSALPTSFIISIFDTHKLTDTLALSFLSFLNNYSSTENDVPGLIEAGIIPRLVTVLGANTDNHKLVGHILDCLIHFAPITSSLSIFRNSGAVNIISVFVSTEMETTDAVKMQAKQLLSLLNT
ncbi:hypothetical protein BLNAU_20327 [Blattamonas nauphoetae]|uniref:Uncharacterized protein n=1 Tax=Blattamonas nauphoetae TaxID=2049346 RepID=A0ABQ9X1E4_9EUKA|nr:hypothetical protein BLNAU_20327 [Blattamonas nauphoetae]